jgi:MSHA pilin protein MshA
LKHSTQRGFTLIELVTVIVILAILSAIALPRFIDLQQNARIATLQGIQGSMRSAVSIAKVNALANGIGILDANPGNGTQQSTHIVFMEGFSAEVDWRNLCPESKGDLANVKHMYHFINLTDDDLEAQTIHTLHNNIQLWYNNQYTVVGYDIPDNGDAGPGCYVLYDSFGDPQCTTELITNEC